MQKKALKWLVLFFLVTPTICSFSQVKKYKLDAKSFYNELISVKDPFIIDTRPGYKFQENRIQNAVLAESQDELLKLTKIIPKDTPIFVYCQIGDRSKRAVKALRGNGFTRVYELEDGLVTWIEAGLPLDTIKLE
nr:rhodanese-like domain-containing protein [uncultured Carboxylicivirga sp.]